MSNQDVIATKTYPDSLFAAKMEKWAHPVAIPITDAHADSTTDAKKTQNVLEYQNSQIPKFLLTLRFNGVRKFTSPTLFEDQTLRGVIRQDTTPGDEKFAIEITFLDNLNNGALFEVVQRVIRKSENGTFVQVRLKCRLN